MWGWLEEELHVELFLQGPGDVYPAPPFLNPSGDLGIGVTPAVQPAGLCCVKPCLKRPTQGLDGGHRAGGTVLGKRVSWSCDACS